MHIEFSKDVGFTDFSIILFFSKYDLTNKIYTRYLFLKYFLVCGLNSYVVFNK